MTDGYVGIKQSDSPDRYLDNEEVTNPSAPGGTAWRQRVIDLGPAVVASTDNSTTTPLGAGATYVGTGEEVLDYAETTLTVAVEPSSAEGTLYFEYSPDGTNWDTSIPTPVTAGFVVPIRLATVNQFFRVRYENGATPQTALRLQTLHHRTGAKHLTRTLSTPVDDNEPVEFVRAVLTGSDPSGAFLNFPIGGNVAALSTATLLPAGGVFQSGWEATVGFVAMGVAVRADQDGDLVLEFATDDAGVNLVRTLPLAVTGADDGIFFAAPVQAPYVRVTYTNGPIGQNDFDLAVQFDTSSPAPLIQPLETVAQATQLAALTKAGLVAADDADDYAAITRLGEGLRTSILAHETDTPIRPASSWRARSTLVPDDTAIQLVSAPFTDRLTVEVQNEAAQSVFLSETQAGASNPSQRRQLFPAGSVVLDLDEGAAIWSRAEPGGGSSTGLVVLDPATINDSGATNPNNALTENDSRATLDTAAEYVEGDGYTADRTFDEVTAVIVGAELRKQAGQTQVPVAQDPNSNTNGGNHTSTTVAVVGGADHYLLLVAFGEQDGDAVVSSIVGAGDPTWSEVTSFNHAGGNTRLSVWETDEPVTTGTLTINFAGTVRPTAVGVLAVDGVTGRAGGFSVVEGTSASPSVSRTVTSGRLAVALLAHGNATMGAVAGWTEQVDAQTSGGPREAGAGIATRLGTGAAITFNPTLSSSEAWVATMLSFIPSPAVDPVVTISYTIAGDGTGASSTQEVVSAEVDTEVELDVTADRVWTFDDIDDLEVRVTVDSIGAADVEIDHVYVKENNASSGSSARVSVTEVAS